MKFRLTLVLVSCVASVLMGLALSRGGGAREEGSTRAAGEHSSSDTEGSGAADAKNHSLASTHRPVAGYVERGALAGRSRHVCEARRRTRRGRGISLREQRRQPADQGRRSAHHQESRYARHHPARRRGVRQGRRTRASGRLAGALLRPPLHHRLRPRSLHDLRQRESRRVTGKVYRRRIRQNAGQKAPRPHLRFQDGQQCVPLQAGPGQHHRAAREVRCDRDRT